MPALFAGLIATLLLRLGAPAAPATLIHCTAGKDRTGFVCALLLAALGVHRDDIFANYLLTRQRRPPEDLLKVLLGDELAHQSAATRAALMVMADVREDYLGTALSRIDGDFGGIERYLAKACQLDDQRRDQLFAALLAG